MIDMVDLRTRHLPSRSGGRFCGTSRLAKAPETRYQATSGTAQLSRATELLPLPKVFNYLTLVFNGLRRSSENGPEL